MSIWKWILGATFATCWEATLGLTPLLADSPCQAKSNWNRLSETITGGNGGHTFRIEIGCSNFKAHKRKIGWIKANASRLYYPGIDGHRTWVSDGLGAEDIKKQTAEDFLTTRTIEVQKFEVFVDGRRWAVPHRLTFDLLNLDLDDPSEPNNDHGHAWLSKDGRRLVLKQEASDGGGGYCAYFIMHSNGQIERRIYIESHIVG
jgi:hypothetical protein